MTNEPFYRRVGPAAFEPTRATESPWDQSLQHGGPPSALLLGEIEKAVAGHGRITAAQIDFLGAIPREPGEVGVRTLRPGRRVRLDAATLTIGGRVVAEARCWTMTTSAGADRRVEHRSSPLPPHPVRPARSALPRVPGWLALSRRDRVAVRPRRWRPAGACRGLDPGPGSGGRG